MARQQKTARTCYGYHPSQRPETPAPPKTPACQHDRQKQYHSQRRSRNRQDGKTQAQQKRTQYQRQARESGQSQQKQRKTDQASEHMCLENSQSLQTSE